MTTKSFHIINSRDYKTHRNNNDNDKFMTYAHLCAWMIDEYHLRLLAIQKYANGFFAKFVIYENKYIGNLLSSVSLLLSIFCGVSVSIYECKNARMCEADLWNVVYVAWVIWECAWVL